MSKGIRLRWLLSALTAFVVTAGLMLSIVPNAFAANRRFITEVTVAAGENAVERLEAQGWSVVRVGLNITTEAAKQVYLAYKLNTGNPVTNVIVSSDVGDRYTDANGIVYECVSHVDLDEGIGGGTGCIYATRDKRAGSPIVGLDVLRSNAENKEVLYAITNDGAEIVRTPAGAPADVERASKTNSIYLAQIHDGIVRPYISEIGIVTDTDKWNAVYTACERGYDYFVEGDIDESSDTYTIIAFERTADPKAAVTNIAAVSEKTVKALEAAGASDSKAADTGKVTAAALSISGTQYIRVSSKPVKAKEPYYLYVTKDSKAGNPVSMLYVESPKQTQNFLLGAWANAYFFSPGKTTAYTYSVNENLYETLWADTTVCCKLPVRLFDSYSASSAPAQTTAPANPEPTTVEATSAQTAETASATASAEQETAQKAPVTQAPVTETAQEDDGAAKFINLTMLTPRDGLPDTAVRLTSMSSDSFAFPYTERTARSDRIDKFQASIFGKRGGIALIAGGVVIVAAAAFTIYKLKPVINSSGKSKKGRRQA